MNKNLFYIGIAALLMPAMANAQTAGVDYTGRVRIIPQEVRQKGDSVCLRMSVSLNGANVDRRNSMEVIPVLTNGEESRNLPKISIQGKRKHKEYRRQLALMSARERAAYAAPLLIVQGYGDAERTLEYTYAVPFEPWMETAWLETKTDLCGCGEATQMSVERLADRVTLEQAMKAFVFQPQLAFVPVKTDHAGIKQRIMQGEAFLDFAVAKTDIRPEFGNNPRELAKLRGMIDTIRYDKGVTVRGIDITGYASPEGSLAMNKRLSEGRAKALKSYLQHRYDFPEHAYTVHFGGEDWDGLVQLLALSDLPEKERILDIIEHTSIENGREKQIMNLAGGQPYRYLLNNLFPSLRRVICRVDYEVKSFSVEEAKEVLKTRPQNLSLPEMYAVAATYAEGSEAFCDVFETAVKLFPGDETARLNAAIAALSRKDTVLAGRYLDKVSPTVYPLQYANAMGILYTLQADYGKAAGYFETAAAAGLDAAASNLAQIRENGLVETKQ